MRSQKEKKLGEMKEQQSPSLLGLFPGTFLRHNFMAKKSADGKKVYKNNLP